MVKRRTGKINKRKGGKIYDKKKRKTKRKMNHMNTMRNYTKRKNTRYKNTKYKNTKLRNNKRRNMRGGSYDDQSHDDQMRRAIELSLMDMERAGGSGENKEWSCPACTLHNAASSQQCVVCDTPRGASNPVNLVSRDRARGVASHVEGVQSDPIETRGQIINRTKLEAAQVRLAFAKLLIDESGLIDNIPIYDIIIKIGGDLLTDKLLVVLSDNHPRRKWEEWKALYAPGEVQEPEFNVDQVTFTLDNLNIGDRYSVGLGNHPGALVNYRGEFEITDFNYTLTNERFLCEVKLSEPPNNIEFIYNNPVSRVGAMQEEGVGWTTRWRSSVWDGTVINCSRIEPS